MKKPFTPLASFFWMGCSELMVNLKRDVANFCTRNTTAVRMIASTLTADAKL